MLGVGRQVALGQAADARVVGRQERREHGHEHEEPDDGAADERGRAVPHAAQRIGPEADRAVLGNGADGGGRGGHEYRIRGLRNP